MSVWSVWYASFGFVVFCSVEKHVLHVHTDANIVLVSINPPSVIYCSLNGFVCFQSVFLFNFGVLMVYLSLTFSMICM